MMSLTESFNRRNILHSTKTSKRERNNPMETTINLTLQLTNDSSHNIYFFPGTNISVIIEAGANPTNVFKLEEKVNNLS